MIVYSKKIIAFVDEIKCSIKNILSKEIRLKVHGDRFYDRSHRFSYPIKIVIYNHKSMLGYFDPAFYELGFHECLVHTHKENLHNIIRHELAHYMTFIQHGETQPHGVEFRTFCDLLGWDERIYRATICLDDEKIVSGCEENHILRKIQKLIALSTSSNKNEAEQAMIKSQQLLLKHNIESKSLDSLDEEKVFLKRIMKQKRENAKMRSIAKILETFFVSTVYRRAGDFIYLEILGNAVNIEIAEYVASFLNEELEKLWAQAQILAHLKGMVAKNSFFLGLSKGYCNKILALKREYNQDTTNALMVIEKKLINAKEMVYQKLTSTKSSGNYCHESSALGEKMGKQLNITPAIKSSATHSIAQIAYSS